MTGKRSLAVSWLPFPTLIHAKGKWIRNLGRRMQNCAVGWGRKNFGATVHTEKETNFEKRYFLLHWGNKKCTLMTRLHSSKVET